MGANLEEAVLLLRAYLFLESIWGQVEAARTKHVTW